MCLYRLAYATCFRWSGSILCAKLVLSQINSNWSVWAFLSETNNTVCLTSVDSDLAPQCSLVSHRNFCIVVYFGCFVWTFREVFYHLTDAQADLDLFYPLFLVFFLTCSRLWYNLIIQLVSHWIRIAVIACMSHLIRITVIACMSHWIRIAVLACMSQYDVFAADDVLKIMWKNKNLLSDTILSVFH